MVTFCTLMFMVTLSASCDPPLTDLHIRNDLNRTVTIRSCDDNACRHAERVVLKPGQQGGWSGYDQLVEVVDGSGKVLGCLRYIQPADRPRVATLRVSQARRCPAR